MDTDSGGAGTGAVERDPVAVTAEVRRKRSRPPLILPEEVLERDILTRLPAKDLLRFRAVCVSWGKMISNSGFQLAHHERQPSLPLISLQGKTRRENFLCDFKIDALDLGRDPAERRPVLGFNDYGSRRSFLLHASCNGLLLLSLSNGRFNICNPATRQWASIPALTSATIAGLYLHSLSGEYRVLYWSGKSQDRSADYYVLTVGSSEGPRCISCPVASDSMKQVMLSGINLAYGCLRRMFPPVFLRNCLHWDPNRCLNNNRVVVFDTVLESFRSMSSPTAAQDARLLEMDNRLCISSLDDSGGRMNLWVLQDYESEDWSLRYQIELPALEVSRFGATRKYLVLSHEGDMLAWCPWGSYLLHCDSNGELLQELLFGESWQSKATGHWFKESLVRHSFFPIKHSGRLGQPRYFRGL